MGPYPSRSACRGRLAWSIRTTADAFIIFLLAGCRATYLIRLVPALLLVLFAYGMAQFSQPPPVWALLRAAGMGVAVLGCGLTIEPALREFVTGRVQTLFRRRQVEA